MHNNHIYHVIKDPIHGTMQFTSLEDLWVKPFIDSPHFQRLRHIKQLGLGDYIFPGAVHSRFNHCLGCAYVAGQIANKIGLSDDERQLVMVACLLHDIGHGPISHAFEDIFTEKMIRHEDWTPYFLADYKTPQFFEKYNHINPNTPLTYDKFQAIEQMIMHKLPAKNVLGDIVSSQLDADRLDYLLRDSHFCGVRYGEYDFRWMLHCMTIVAVGSTLRLGITHKGIGVVEHYLMARRLMLNNIYRSHKKLAIERLLIHLLQLLAYESEDNKTLHEYLGKTRLGKFLLAVNKFNRDIEKGGDRIALKHTFLQDNYAHFKALCDYDVFLCIEETANMQNQKTSFAQLAKRINERIMPKIIRIDHSHFKQASSIINEFKSLHSRIYADWQLLLIETPHQSYSGEEDPILVFNEYGEIKPIEHYSFMLSAISNKLEHVAFLAIDKVIADEEPILNLIRMLH